VDAKALLLTELQSGQWAIEQFVADFVESDWHAPLLEGGQTALWIIGHIATAEDWLVAKATGGEMQISPEIHAAFKAGPPPSTKPDAYPSKSAVLDLLKTQRERTQTALAAADAATWDNPAPEGVPPVAKDIGGVWGLVATHPFWHVGQLTTIRRMLGKPALLT